MKEFVEKLKKHADRFFENAISDYKTRNYDVAMFNLEQAAQLYIKSKILSFGVQFPKIHQLKKLLIFLKKLGEKGVDNILKDSTILETLDFAYISSRYLPFSFTKKDVEKAIKFVRKLRKILWKR